MHIKRTDVKLEKQDATSRKASLEGKASLTRTGPPSEGDVQDVLAGPGKTTSPNHSATTHVAN